MNLCVDPLRASTKQPLQWIGLPLMVLMLFCSATLRAGRDCTSTANLADTSIRGSLRAQGSTTQSGCTGRTTYVWMRLTGLSYFCTGDTWQSQCYASSASGNAVTSLYRQSYGTAGAQSTHQYREGETYTSLDGQSVTLDARAPDPQEECEAAGNLWVDGNCEYNPDPGSPIVIATGNGARYKLTSPADGVVFDLDGDGVLERVAWTEGNEDIAFLAIDRDGDGYITSGKELFGNFTLPGVGNGFAALARMNMETNGGVKRGSVSAEDPLFDKLLLWTDRNHNGVSEPSELRPAGSVLSDIGLAYETDSRRDKYGNAYKYRGWVHIRTAPGRNKAVTLDEDRSRVRLIYDVFLMKQ